MDVREPTLAISRGLLVVDELDRSNRYYGWYLKGLCRDGTAMHFKTELHRDIFIECAAKYYDFYLDNLPMESVITAELFAAVLLYEYLEPDSLVGCDVEIPKVEDQPIGLWNSVIGQIGELNPDFIPSDWDTFLPDELLAGRTRGYDVSVSAVYVGSLQITATNSVQARQQAAIALRQGMPVTDLNFSGWDLMPGEADEVEDDDSDDQDSDDEEHDSAAD